MVQFFSVSMPHKYVEAYWTTRTGTKRLVPVIKPDDCKHSSQSFRDKICVGVNDNIGNW